MRKIALLIAVSFLTGCSPVSKQEIDFLSANPALNIKVPCRTAEWDVVTTVEDKGKTATVNSKVLFMDGNYRIEIFDDRQENKQVILLDKEALYVLGYDGKAYKYAAGMREAEVFLRRVFVNTGAARKPEITLDDEAYNGQKCTAVEYEMLRSVNGLYAKTKVKEWRNRKGATVKMEANLSATEFEISGAKMVIGPLKETYETRNYKCGVKLMGMLFSVPMGMKTVDYQKEYMEKLKASGKKADADSGTMTFTVK